MNKNKLSRMLPTILATSFISITPAYAHDGRHNHQTEPVTLLVNFQIASSGVSIDPTGTPYYIVGGPGYVPERIRKLSATAAWPNSPSGVGKLMTTSVGIVVKVSRGASCNNSSN